MRDYKGDTATFRTSDMMVVMSTKSFVWLFLFIGSIIGGWIPTIFGASWFSVWSLVGNTVGSLAGIWIGFTIGQKMNG